MKTEAMQARLDALYAEGYLQAGKSYDIMPSDCSGNGYDVALSPRTDESGLYTIAGSPAIVICTCKVGSTKWHDGIPVGYRLEYAPIAPYALRDGEKAIIVHRTGSNIGNSYMARVCASIAIQRADGSYVYHGHTPYWLGTTSTYASHYHRGLNKRDTASYDAEVAILQYTVDLINSTH